MVTDESIRTRLSLLWNLGFHYKILVPIKSKFASRMARFCRLGSVARHFGVDCKGPLGEQFFLIWNDPLRFAIFAECGQ